jgi:3-oxoacyl-ACP reductase-like protein
LVWSPKQVDVQEFHPEAAAAGATVAAHAAVAATAAAAAGGEQGQDRTSWQQFDVLPSISVKLSASDIESS